MIRYESNCTRAVSIPQLSPQAHRPQGCDRVVPQLIQRSYFLPMTVNPFPLVRGPWIAREYYNREQPENFHDGRLVTGDVAKIDSEAYLIIANRSKDLIKTGGEWISSVDLEHHIVAIPGVSQACVVAAPHPKWDERPIATLILDARSALVPHSKAGRRHRREADDDLSPRPQ